MLVTGYDTVDPNIFYINGNFSCIFLILFLSLKIFIFHFSSYLYLLNFIDPYHNFTTYYYSDMSDLLLYEM